MIIIKQAKTLTDRVKQERKKQRKIGFVPTMGALHPGHLSLIAASKSNNDITVCSIFVNPTQFNNPEDFKHYPITIEKDIAQLIAAGCDIVFLPSVEEIYPPGYQKSTTTLALLKTGWKVFTAQGISRVFARWSTGCWRSLVHIIFTWVRKISSNAW